MVGIKKSGAFVVVNLFLFGMLMAVPSYACGEHSASACVTRPNYNPLTHLCGIVRASTDLADDILYAAQELATVNVQ